MIGKEIREELKVNNVTKRLEKLRHFGLVNFDVRIIAQKKGMCPVYVYWRKE